MKQQTANSTLCLKLCFRTFYSVPFIGVSPKGDNVKMVRTKEKLKKRSNCRFWPSFICLCTVLSHRQINHVAVKLSGFTNGKRFSPAFVRLPLPFFSITWAPNDPIQNGATQKQSNGPFFMFITMHQIPAFLFIPTVNICFGKGVRSSKYRCDEKSDVKLSRWEEKLHRAFKKQIQLGIFN